MTIRTRNARYLLLISLWNMALAGGTHGAPMATEQDPAIFMKTGQEAYQRGAFSRALTEWKHAAQVYETRGEVARQSRALVSAAQAAQALGQTKQALQLLELAWALAQQDADLTWRATVLAALGRSYLGARQLDAAADYLMQAQQTAKGSTSAHLHASITHDQGVLAALRKHEREALDAFTETLRIAMDGGLPAAALHARINAARSAVRLHELQKAREWLDEAMAQLTAWPVSHDKATGLVSVGLLYGELAPLIPTLRNPLMLRAAGTLQEAITAAEGIPDARMLSYGKGHLGHLYETEARFDEAILLTRGAVFSAQSAGAPESLYRWQWQLGRLLSATGKLDEAIASYRQAAATVQPIRHEVTAASGDTALSSPQSVRPMYFELADLLLQRASLNNAPKVAEEDILAARDVIETYKAAELRDYFKDDCVDLAQANISRSETLSPTTAVIYPIIFPTRLELLVSTPSGVTRITVPVDADHMTKEIRAFRQTVEKRTTREYLPHAQQLYEWLVRPLEPDLQRMGVTTLVFVPDSALRTIPIAALHDGTGFLIQKFSLAVTPGLTLTDPRPLKRDKTRFLASGLTKAVQGYPPLPYVEQEMESIRALYASDELLNQDFLTARLERELRNSRYGILHIATHGKFSSDVDDSFLLTFDGRLTMSKLDQLIGLFRYREDPLELLTLSACQTGIGDDRAALGLAGVAIKAGARSAVATLWFINDEASATLLSEFYRQLRNPSLTKAEAMRQAQVKLLDDRVYQHPAYWSPFLLLNNWL